MPRPKPEQLRRWLVPATLLALTPKCILCVLAYTGLGAALGLGGPELCGTTGGPSSSAPLALLAAGGVAAAAFSFCRLFNRPHRIQP